jgi:hypothetical protein
MINNRFNVVYHLLYSVFIRKFVLMRELDNNLMCKIFKEINSDKHKIPKAINFWYDYKQMSFWGKLKLAFKD